MKKNFCVLLFISCLALGQTPSPGGSPQSSSINGESFGATAADRIGTNNRAAWQTAITAAYGSNRKNGDPNLKFNRTLRVNSLYNLNNELNLYHLIGFNFVCEQRLNSGFTQLAPNQRIVNAQSIAYGSFNDCSWTGGARQDSSHPLLDLDYDGSQGSDLRPQFIDFVRNGFFGGSTSAVGVSISKSGGGAQGSNIYWWNPAFKGFTTAGIRIGTPTSYAQNALALAVYGGDFQDISGNAIANYGGGYIIVDGTTFENGYGPQQIGFDMYHEGGQGPFIVRGVRSESRRLIAGSTIRVYDSAIIDQDHKWDTLGSDTWPLNTYLTGTDKCGNGATWQVTNKSAPFGGITTAQHASSGTANTIGNSNARYTNNAFVGYRVCIMSGAGVNHWCSVTANDSTTITCAGGWTSNYAKFQLPDQNPDYTSSFAVEPDWDKISSPFVSGGMTMARVNENVVEGPLGGNGGDMTLENVSLNGLQVKATGRFSRFHKVFSPRPDWLTGAFAFEVGTASGIEVDDVQIWRGSEGPFPWRPVRNSGGTVFFKGPFQALTQKAWVWPCGQFGNGQSCNDVWIGGRTDVNSLNSISRNILEFGGTLGRATPVNQTDANGSDTDVEGGLPTGAGTPGRIRFWFGSSGSHGTKITDGTVQSTIYPGGIQVGGNKVYVASDFFTSSTIKLQTIAGLSWNLPTYAESYSFSCDLMYSQAPGNAAVAFGIQSATVSPTNVNSTGFQQTATTGFTGGSVTGISDTDAHVIVSATPSTTATIYTVHLGGTVENSGRSNTLRIMVSTANASDIVTIRRGSYCTLN